MESVEEVGVVRDPNGTELHGGDTVAVTKDLKLKNIRLVEGDHAIDRRIDGFGAMKLKSEFVRKA